MISRRQAGFTLVELLLAMAFFSFILLFVTTGFILVNRSYNKGITVKLVQDEGRQLIEELTRNIRVADPLVISYASDCLALNGVRYHWSTPTSGSGAPYKMIRQETDNNCTSPYNGPGVELLNERVGIQYLTIADAGSNSYSMDLKISTADKSLLAGGDCSIGSGDQFCDVVEFSTVVSARTASD